MAEKKKTGTKAGSKKQAKATKKKVASQPSSPPAPQPEVNIGLVGHVDHGKTTLTERLTGKWTDTHSEEIKRGITIRLGYADSIFRKCPKCSEPDNYTIEAKCPICGSETTVLRKVSFVDAPGHESLMATMLAGATIMDGAVLLVAANEFCPQPQTREHLMALQIIGIKNLVVVQNKVDLVTKERALANYKQIKDFLKGTDYEKSPIIPISAAHGLNIGALIKSVEEIIPTPKRDPKKTPVMFVARSFDINKPGTEIAEINGGVLGGSLKQGVLSCGQEIEIKPGLAFEEKNQIIRKPVRTKIVSIATGNEQIDKATPGGSIAIMTSLDPSIVKSDKLTGSLIGLPDKLPAVYNELKLEIHLLDRVVGSKEDLEVKPIAKTESLMLNVNSASTVGIVTDLHKGFAQCKLKLPVCAEVGSRVTISRLIGNRFRLIGYGVIME
ncbi:translation initiation factor IF-2 subunit gamma [Candidatus Woesearchaeota archaeon]|nr:translation initiation factor IF-2 subunit gamma [Candidatus Woesearchaeota archaeon]